MGFLTVLVQLLLGLCPVCGCLGLIRSKQAVNVIVFSLQKQHGLQPFRAVLAGIVVSAYHTDCLH